MAGDAEGDASDEPDLPILDAGPAVGFAAVNALPILHAALTSLAARLMTPYAVDQEVVRQARKYPGVETRWISYRDSKIPDDRPPEEWAPRIEVLPKIKVGVGDDGGAQEPVPAPLPTVLPARSICPVLQAGVRRARW